MMWVCRIVRAGLRSARASLWTGLVIATGTCAWALPAPAQTAPVQAAAQAPAAQPPRTRGPALQSTPKPEAEPDTNTEPGAPSVRPATRESRFSRPAEREIRFQEGLLHYSRGQLDRAEQDFQSIVNEDPADAEAYYYLGLSQLDQNKAQSAVQNFTQSLRLDPTPDELHAARAAALIRLRRFDEAEKDIAVLEADPRWQGLVHYLRGHLNYSKGNLEAAAREFAAARQTGQAEAMPAGLYEGLTYLRMRELVQARRSFRAAAVGAEGDPEVTSAAQQLDTVLARYGRERRRLDAQLTLGYEWDSNVIQLGDQPLPTGITNESDSTFVVQPRLRYSLFRKGKLDLGAEGSGYFTWHQDLNDFDLASYQGGPYLNYTIRKNLYASARYSFNYVTLGNDPFLIRHIATPQLTLIEPEFGYTSGYYQWQARQFQEPTVLEPFDRDGQVHRVGVIQGIYLPAIFKGADKSTLELSYRFENQQTQGSDFDADFHTIGATLYVPLPWWKLKGDIGASYGFDLYDNRNSLENDPFVIEAADDRRRDGELNLSVGLTKKFSDWLSARVDYTYTDNESNITAADGTQPYDYDRHVVGARLILSY